MDDLNQYIYYIFYSYPFIQEKNSDHLWIITPIVISVFALFISWLQYRSSVTHNKNSIRPLLTIDYTDDPQNYSFEVNLKNKGHGTAIVDGLRFRHKKKWLNIDEQRKLANLCIFENFTKSDIEKEDGLNFNYLALTPGESHRILSFSAKSIPNNKNSHVKAYFTYTCIKKNFFKLAIFIRYENIYRDKFFISTQDDENLSIKQVQWDYKNLRRQKK